MTVIHKQILKEALLPLEVLHQALHVLELSLQLDLLVAQAVELPAEVGDVGLEHGVDV